MQLLKRFGFVNLSSSFIALLSAPPLSIVIIFLQSTWPPIQSSIDIHFVRENVALGEVRVLHVPTSAQFADIFKKGLPTASFIDIRSSLNVIYPDVATAGGY
jgi:hypothetical protein